MAFTFTATVAGAAQFSAAAAQTVFTELGPEINAVAPRDMYVEILQYSYASIGAAHEFNLFLATAPAVGANLQVILEGRASINSITENCKIRVPRQLSGSGLTFQLFCSTVGKADNATLRVTYRIARDGGQC